MMSTDEFIEILINKFRLEGEVQANITFASFSSGDPINGKQIILNENPARIGFIVQNKSTNSVYVAFSANPASSTNFTNEIGANSGWEYQPIIHPYKGQITFNPSVAGDGKIMVTELINVIPRKR